MANRAIKLAAALGMASGIAISMVVATPAHAQDVRRDFSIRSQSLAGALVEFSKQSDQVVTAPARLTRGKAARPVQGNYTARTALEMLLTGTGLRIRTNAQGSFVLEERQSQGNAAVADDSAGEGERAEIVITGSRIKRTTYDTPSPVTVENRADIERKGFSNVYQALNQLPQFAPGQGPGNDAFAAPAELGAQFLNLRGLGTNRTLVLIDGRRRVSGGSTTAATDLSSIPSNMIERAEVVTGGAAAIYGADAVSGVVNVILRENVDGLELSTRQGLSSRGDGYSYSYGGIFGGKVGDRGRVTIGVSYNHDNMINWTDRPWARSFQIALGNPADTGPADGIPNQIVYDNFRYRPGTPGGSFKIGELPRMTYENGALRALRNDSTYPYAGPADDPIIAFGGDGYNPADFVLLRGRLSTISAMTHFTYEVLDGVNLTSDLQFGQTKALNLADPYYPDIELHHEPGRDNPFIPAAIKSLMDERGLTSLTVQRTGNDQGRTGLAVTRSIYTGTVRLNGRLNDRIAWQVFGQYGRFDNRSLSLNDKITSRASEATDVVLDPETGRPVCFSATARAAGCTPINVLGINSIDPAALPYFNYNARTLTTNTQFVSGGDLNGSLFDLPAGSVKFSAGVEYRRETIDVQGDPLAAQGLLALNFGRGIKADFDVTEAYGELVVPILRDVPFFQTLEIDGAARLSDYSTIGSTFTWKAGLVWAPVSDVRLRATISHSVRAPNLNELYTPATVSTSTLALFDPCDATQLSATANRAKGCAASGVPANFRDIGNGGIYGAPKALISGGNASLKEESSDSITIGAIFEPRFLPGFRAAIDYFQIKMTDAVENLDLDSVIRACYDTDPPASTACSLITRRADHSIEKVLASSVNIGRLIYQGIDFSADYRTNAGAFLGRPVTISASFVGSYNFKYDQTPDATQPENVLKLHNSALMPNFRSSLTLGADVGELKANWTLRYIASSKNDANATPEEYDLNHIPSRLYNDVYITYNFTEKATVGLGVSNIFDKAPPFLRSGYHDTLGRSFFMTANMKF
jgi:iron complex outermembrane receptor protein